MLFGSEHTRDEDGFHGLGSGLAKYLEKIPQLPLGVDHSAVLLHEVPVVSQPADQPALGGRVGGDLLVGGYELDFHQMHFSVLSRDR